MAQELIAIKTPITKEEAIRALWHGWLAFFGAPPPKKECIWLLTAQWGLETGWGKSMWNYNFGNVKSIDGDGHDYQFFACNEILDTGHAEQLQEASPQTVKVVPYKSLGKSVVWFYPKHPGCRFRAFADAAAGATDHISLVNRRFSKAWPSVLTGDPQTYAKALKAQGYYTADEYEYMKGLVGCYNMAAKAQIDYTTLDVLTASDVEHLQALVGMSLQSSLASIFETYDDDDYDTV